MLILLSLLMFLTALIAIKNDLKIAGYALLGYLSLDILSQILRHFVTGPKPYTGNSFIFWFLSTVCYLGCGAWLAYCAGWSANSKTLKQASIISVATVAGFILLAYPTVAGASMLTLFYSFFAALYVASLVICARSIIQEPRLNNVCLVLLSLGGISEIFILTVFGFPYYWLISVSNCIFYLVVLVVSLLSSKYKNLLKP